jgi:hypothetical protein
VVVAAVRLSEWVGGDGVPVTPGGSLRPADVTAAAAALGIIRRGKVRRAADVPEVHRPWLVAVAAGLITVEDNRAVQAGRLADPLAAWWAGLRGLLADEAADRIGVDPRIIALATMDVVTSEGVGEGFRLRHRVGHIMYDRGDWDSFADPQRHGHLHPAEAAVAALRLFGALEGTRLTPLGTWVHAELRRVVPPQITPEMPAEDLLGQLAEADEVDAWNRASRWFGDRTRDQIVPELVRSAAEASSADRITAVTLVSGLGDEAVAALLATEPLPDNLAAHARMLAHQHDLAPSPGVEDLVWLAAEHTHAELVRHGVTAARYMAEDALDAAEISLNTDGIDRLASSGHPHATEVAEALAAVVGTAVPVQQLKVSLSGQCWRRLLIPENATLETLHHVIIALFGWDNDHLHEFTIGHRRYADPFHGLEETVPEYTMRLHQALPRPKATISHTYDFGASWQHEITLERVLNDHPLERPECVTGKGGDPIEYYDPDEHEEPSPFDVAAIYERLRKVVV